MPNQLSGGQQQRIALARALVIEPDVVLLDEPLSNLDAKLRVEMRTQIKEIHRKIGRTMIYVTHDQAEALSMADRIGVMRRGRLVQCGTPHELYRLPQSAFVAQFIGGTNLLHGILTEAGEFLTVKTQSGIVRAKTGVTGMQPGAAVFCSVRPESVQVKIPEVSGSTSARDGTNEFIGEVLSSMYLGDSEEYSLRLPDNTVVRAVEYNPTTRKAQVGDRLVLEFDAKAVVVLPQEDLSD
jgi:iron(III) transport system ATP-binding protein